MSGILFVSVFVFFLLLYVGIGVFVSRKLTTVTDYFLASKDLGFISLSMTLMATQIGGGSLLGTAEDAYYYGLYGLLYSIGIAAGFFLLAFGFAERMHRCNVATTAELFERHYQLPVLRKCASILSVITMGGILIAQIVGAKKLLLSIGFFSEPLFAFCWACIILYTMLGGLGAVVLTDAVQICFILVAFISFFIYMLPTFYTSFIDNPVDWTLFSDVKLSFDSLFGLIAMPALFGLIEQDLAQRFFAARSAFVARSSALFAGISVLLFAGIPLLCGMHARLLGVSANYASPLMPYVQLYASPVYAVLIACAIIAAITSTADSLLCAISSNIFQDFDTAWLGGSIITRSRLVTTVVGIIVLVVSRFIDTHIIHILTSSYELSVCCLLVPMLAAYFQIKPNQSAALLSVSGGLISFVLFRYVSISMPKELIALVVSLLCFVVGQWLPRQLGNSKS